MKNRYRIILFISLFLAISLSLTAQSSEEQTLIGTWVFDYERSVAQMDTVARKFFNKMSRIPRRISRFESRYKGRKLTFGSDRSYLLEFSDGNKIDATWSLKDKNKIVVKSSNNSSANYKIVVLTGNELIIEIPPRRGQSSALLSKYYYKKL